MNTVYRKTALGAQAIANRALGVVGRVRSLLIFVDGKRSAHELGVMASSFGDVPQMLAQLVQDGLIEALPVAHGAPTGVSAGSPAPVPAAAALPLSLPQAKILATRLLIEVIGPSSDVMCLRIEATKNLAEYIEAVKRAYALVREIRGAAQAERFGNTIEANLPKS